MASYLTAIALLFVLLVGWILVQQFARLFARRHPEWGPYREKVGCGGCGGGKCADDGCKTGRGGPG
jgi:hypothetical protein